MRLIRRLAIAALVAAGALAGAPALAGEPVPTDVPVDAPAAPPVDGPEGDPPDAPPVDGPDGVPPGAPPAGDPGGGELPPPVEDPQPVDLPPPGLNRAEKMAWEAGQMIDRGQLAAAEAKATLATKVDSGVAAAHYQLARAKFRQGRLGDALQAARNAADADPKYLPGQALALRLGVLSEQRAVAVGRIERAAKEHPDVLGLQLVLAEGQLALGQHTSAMRTAREVLKKAETSVGAMKILARAYIATGKDTAAMAILERAVELDKDAEAYNLMAGIYLSRGKIVSARNFLERAVELDRYYVEGLTNLGVVYIKVRNWLAAKQVLDKVTMLAPGMAAAYLNLGSAQRGAKEFAKAETSWRQALKLDKTLADAWYNLAILYLENPMEGREREKQLQDAIDAFNTYKRERAPSGKPDPTVDKYIAEARILIEQERERKKEELKQLEESAKVGEGDGDGDPPDDGGDVPEDGGEPPEDGGTAPPEDGGAPAPPAEPPARRDGTVVPKPVEPPAEPPPAQPERAPDPPKDPPTDPPRDPPRDPPTDPPQDPPQDPPKDPPKTDPPKDPPVDVPVDPPVDLPD